jgi:hypothetical protein
MIFCKDHKKCVIFEKKEDCRFPKKARMSISGIGVNFQELSNTAGWQFNKITQYTKPNDVSMGMMAGLVLIG